MSNEESKKAAAIRAVERIKTGMRVGLGTGTTVKYAIEELAKQKKAITCVASSVATEQLAKKLGLKLASFNENPEVTVYIDGADEVDKAFNLIKGGGGALTREKIIASSALEFVCVVDESKLVKKIGRFPLPVEVIPFAEKYVMAEFEELGGRPQKRAGFTTDNGNIIIDVAGLAIDDPWQLETELNNIPGVVENGIFAVRQPDYVYVGKGKNVDVLVNNV
jgi:ribose 5-phosphate isomerase A